MPSVNRWRGRPLDRSPQRNLVHRRHEGLRRGNSEVQLVPNGNQQLFGNKRLQYQGDIHRPKVAPQGMQLRTVGRAENDRQRLGAGVVAKRQQIVPTGSVS